jgi:hypothetical protein
VYFGTWGNYAGDDTANRPISHNIARVPTLIFIADNIGNCYLIFRGHDFIQPTGVAAPLAVNPMEDVRFFVGNAADYGNSANALGRNYWWAIV